MTISDLPPRPPPSSLSEINERLTELARSQDMLFEQLAHLTAQIERALAGVKTNMDEVSENHIERVHMVRDVADLKDRVAILERKVQAA